MEVARAWRGRRGDPVRRRILFDQVEIPPHLTPMDQQERERVRALLQAVTDGDGNALDEVFSIVYGELRSLAHSQRRRWEGDYTFDTTALVHEAYLKLVDHAGTGWNDAGHFMAVAARAMRQILVNYAERRRAAKRGGGQQPVTLDDSNPIAAEAADEVIALHEALEQLEQVNPRQARVVEARFFAGLSVAETAKALGVSTATVKRDWGVTSAWLHREIRMTLK